MMAQRFTWSLNGGTVIATMIAQWVLLVGQRRYNRGTLEAEASLRLKDGGQSILFWSDNWSTYVQPFCDHGDACAFTLPGLPSEQPTSSATYARLFWTHSRLYGDHGVHGGVWPYCVPFCLPCATPDQAPVPLSIFRSNSKFDENSKHSSVKYTRPITTIFCTRHDNVTVVTCAKYRYDRSSIFETRAFWIFIEFRIRSTLC